MLRHSFAIEEKACGCMGNGKTKKARNFTKILHMKLAVKIINEGGSSSGVIAGKKYMTNINMKEDMSIVVVI